MNMNFTEKIYTVTEINSLSKEILEENFPVIMVQGEISNFTVHSSGHIYFTIKDENASIDAVMYRSYGRRLDFTPQRGTKVILKGKISIFVKGGRYQVIALQMKEKGQGELEKKFLQLKEKLNKEGLFDKKHKKVIPEVPQFIGVVTSPTGAAIRDIINVIKRRFANVRILLYPARVQGDLATGEIARGIETLNRLYPDMDVMIVGRGGGSLEDLWPFNEEVVARAIFDSKIPIISAVGHEIDFTIADFVADLRAPTPSAAAELVISNKEELLKKLDRLTMILMSTARNKLVSEKNRLRAVSESIVFRYPMRIIEQKVQEIDYIASNITKNIKYFIDVTTHKLEAVYAKLLTLSPRETMKRGYSITYLQPDGRIIKDTQGINKGSSLKTLFYKGSTESKVTNVNVK